MHLVLATHHLSAKGGSETYLGTVAQHLQRLGHSVQLYTRDPGGYADELESQGLTVARRASELAPATDRLIVQDAGVAYELAQRYPRAPQVFVAHSEIHDFQLPPVLPVSRTVVALNDRVLRRLQGLAGEREITRLSQPVDVDVFRPSGDPNPVARRALLMGNYLSGPRLAMLEGACHDAELELHQYGAHIGLAAETPELLFADADVVVGQGRVIVEALAAGRAAYVFDHRGASGWVLESNYRELEKDGFAGVSAPRILDRAGLASDLQGYSVEMGVVNRSLASAFHDARHHTARLLELATEGTHAPTVSSPTPLSELARLVRLQWQTEGHGANLARENLVLRAQRDKHEIGQAAALRDADEAERRASEAERRLAELSEQLRRQGDELAALREERRQEASAWPSRLGRLARRNVGAARRRLRSRS
jgi:hypothetical protein